MPEDNDAASTISKALQSIDRRLSEQKLNKVTTIVSAAATSIGLIAALGAALWGAAITPLRERVDEAIHYSASKEVVDQRFSDLGAQLAQIQIELRDKANKDDIDRLINEINQRLYGSNQSYPKSQEK